MAERNGVKIEMEKGESGINQILHEHGVLVLKVIFSLFTDYSLDYVV